MISALIAYHQQEGAACTVLTMRPANPHGYGRIVRGEDGGVTAIVEQRDCTPDQAAIVSSTMRRASASAETSPQT